jgi:hypothetical protein
LSLNELRHDDVGAIYLDEVVDSADIRVIESRRELSFAAKALPCRLIDHQFGRQRLESDGATELGVDGPKYRALSALA